MVSQIYKIRSEIWVATTPQIWWPKIIKILAQFCTTSRLYREYLQNATKRRQSENGIASSRTVKLNLVYFGPQMAKIGPEF